MLVNDKNIAILLSKIHCRQYRNDCCKVCLSGQQWINWPTKCGSEADEAPFRVAREEYQLFYWYHPKKSNVLCPSALIMFIWCHYCTVQNVFTRGQFWPSGIVIACVCVCVRVCMCVSLCVNHLLVRVITRDPFKLGSPNLDQICKRPWLRSLLFGGQLTLPFKVKFNLKVRIYPILSLSGP